MSDARLLDGQQADAALPTADLHSRHPGELTAPSAATACRQCSRSIRCLTYFDLKLLPLCPLLDGICKVAIGKRLAPWTLKFKDAIEHKVHDAVSTPHLSTLLHSPSPPTPTHLSTPTSHHPPHKVHDAVSTVTTTATDGWHASRTSMMNNVNTVVGAGASVIGAGEWAPSVPSADSAVDPYIA
jgi:hypothetical protein